jgi:hypothetical protein
MIGARTSLATLLAAVAITSAARAQATCLATGPADTCTTTATTAITVPTILRLTIGSGTTAFGSISQAAYDLGTTDVAGPSVVVKANQAWRVQISSAATFWTAVNTDGLNPARTTKPLADLRWGPTVGGGSWTTMTATPTQIGSGTRTGGTTVPLAFRSAWSYTLDTPGNYSVPVTFTLMSP